MRAAVVKAPRLCRYSTHTFIEAAEQALPKLNTWTCRYASRRYRTASARSESRARSAANRFDGRLTCGHGRRLQTYGSTVVQPLPP
jgi:hypothetical protein